MHETRRRVLDALTEGVVTGPELADRLDVSRTAVWKHVEALRQEGFEIESGNNGYRLAGGTGYGGAAIEYGLEASYTVEFHAEVDSTNRRARALANEGASDTAVVAARQTGGRGRMDREWASPEGGVYVSLVLRPDMPPAHAPAYTLAAAVATADATQKAGVDAEIKWPNDVLVPTPDEPKLAGILTEMEGEADRVSWLVVGIGANVDIAATDLPETATSVREQGGDTSRRAFLQTLLKRFDDLTKDLNAVLPAWRKRTNTLGRRVRVDLPDGVVEGKAVDVEFPGLLVIETGDGTKRVATGDCEHLRPT